MKVYIYTIPKAGTYFLADFIARLGFNNTGMHINHRTVLNTKKVDLETNARSPGQAMEKQYFIKTVRDMRDNDVAFGHFPIPLMSWAFPDFFFVCAYRHPRKTLMSEFIDFRFRRNDIKWITPEIIPDDRDAFCTFLEKHGEGHMAIFSQMLAVTLLLDEPLCKHFPARRFHFLNFESLLAGPEAAVALATSLGVDPALAAPALQETLQAETKTKATGLEIDREALWSDRAEDLYARINAEAYVTRGRELGWTI